MPDWNRNIQYHGITLRAAPSDCKRALDVGCGQGLLARKLARQCEEVVAIDADRDTLLRARAASSAEPRITFVEDDVMTHACPEASFDLITAVATLHHLPLTLALTRFRTLLRPGGTLAVVGLYRMYSLQDYAWATVAVPSIWIMHRLRDIAEVGAPLQDPKETLREIRTACDDVLPGGTFRRHLLFRYSFVWRKP